jgi:L-rhamnonate dehydratase
MWPVKKTFVRIEATDGTVGWSCTNGGEVTEVIIRDQLSRIVIGREVTDIADIWDQMFNSLLPYDRSGFAMMAIAGMDIALWDLKAKSCRQPLIELLGGHARTDIHCYATTEDPAAQAGRGWWGLKAAMSYGLESGDEGLAANVETMRRFRGEAGPGHHVMLDAFMAWDADYTLRFTEASQDIGIFWIEDPLPPYDLEGLRRIRQRAGKGIRLALGNFCFSRWDCEALLREGLVDILQPDVAWAGGITECMRIMHMANAAKVPVILHNTCEQPWALALAAALQSVPVVEFVDRGASSELYTLMGDMPAWGDGRVAVPRNLEGNRPPQYVADFFNDQPRSGGEDR